MDHKAGCAMCGEELTYLEVPELMSCSLCGKEFKSNVKCGSGHYICDVCHSLEADEFIKQFTLKSESRNPVDVAIRLMTDSAVKMHGPEHHFLVPAVLLSAYYNTTGDSEAKEKKIVEAKRRAQHIPGGFCGFYGNCGAGVGTGMYVSLVTDANPLSKDAWKLANLMTSQSLFKIAEKGGPRCCKRDSLLAIAQAVAFTEEHLAVHLEMPEKIVCSFSALNSHCLKDECPFYCE